MKKRTPKPACALSFFKSKDKLSQTTPYGMHMALPLSSKRSASLPAETSCVQQHSYEAVPLHKPDLHA